MKEDFLHYVWKFKKFDFLKAQTTDGEELGIVKVGTHNRQSSGPDFFNAKLRIGDQLWAGNVEIHLRSSDWYMHGHELDKAYDNVILHVVWENDVEIYRKDNSKIPALELKSLADQNALENYRRLMENSTLKWINCEKDFPDFDGFLLENWLERLYVERLEEKATVIEKLLKDSVNDWEGVLFRLLAKNFGLNTNGEAFLSMASSFSFSIIRKLNRMEELEALFFGQIGLLDQNLEDPYYQSLQLEYEYLKRKFNLNRDGVLPVKFFRLRPANFPTVRLHQLAAVYAENKNLFQALIMESNLKKIRELFKIPKSAYWDEHYNFGKKSTKRHKKLTPDFIDLILINTLVPLKFTYSKTKGQADFETLYALMRELPKESNSIIKTFNKIRPKTAKNALDSQALLHLKKNYCDTNRCLECALGLQLLNRKGKVQ